MAPDRVATQNSRFRAETTTVAHCMFCGKQLDGFGYHWTCHVCGAEYCYIHMRRHDLAHPRIEEIDVAD